MAKAAAGEIATEAGKAVISELVPVILSGFNTMLYGVGKLEDKARGLKITIVNTTQDQKLMLDDNYFESGRFWSQPFDPIGPNSSVTFGVCNRDGSIMTGVSGGIGLEAYDVNTGSVISDSKGSWWICTFSNPWIGGTKCLTRWKNYGIKGLYDQMESDAMIRDERCGCYRKEDNHIVFIWKSPSQSW